MIIASGDRDLLAFHALCRSHHSAGPIVGKMMHPYMPRRQKKEEIT
jgi:hypothetical protein